MVQRDAPQGGVTMTDETTGLTRAARDEIAALAAQGGPLTPELLVDAARRKASALHAYFDWDDKSAAQSWRLHTARRLIREVKISVSSSTVTLAAPAYVSVPSEREGGGYRSIVALRSDEDRAREVLLDEIARVLSALARARAVAAALDMEAEISGLTDQVAGLQAQLRAGAQPEPAHA